MSGEQQKFKIMMFPWLAYGHISPFVGLAKGLIQRNFHIILCSTPASLEPFRKSIHEPSLEFMDFHLSTTQLPEIYHTTTNLPSHLISTLRDAMEESKESKESFRCCLKSIKPDILIYDFSQPWASQVASEEGVINSVAFFIVGAACMSLLGHYIIHPEVEFPSESLRFSETEQKFCDIIDFVTNNDAGKERFVGSFERSSAFILIRSSDLIEAKYISYLSELMKKEVIPTGFLIQEHVHESNDDVMFLNWLSKKNPRSVVLVSFGSESFLSKEEMEELALGLESSGASFIWVVRFPVGQKRSLDEVLPQGFRERVGDRGMIVDGWAPQTKILSHSSVGGFVTHCGWSSFLEAMIYGVAVIGMPMKLDRPITARLAVELGIGVEIQRDGGEFTRGEIAKAIKKVVVEEEGKEIMTNVDKLRGEIRGRGDVEMNVALKRIEQLAQT